MEKTKRFLRTDLTAKLFVYVSREADTWARRQAMKQNISNSRFINDLIIKAKTKEAKKYHASEAEPNTAVQN